jgi:hypothetical protein
MNHFGSTIVLLAASGFIGCSSQPTQATVPSVLTARAFLLEDARGVVRASLSAGDESLRGWVVLTLCDSQGKDAMRLMVGPQESRIEMLRDGSGAAVWIETRANEAELEMFAGLEGSRAQRIAVRATPETGMISAHRGGVEAGRQGQWFDTFFKVPEFPR